MSFTVALSSIPLQLIHLPMIIRRFRNVICRMSGPMADGDKFLILDDDFLEKFDEIVVIGDIHGCYDEFKEVLNKVHAETPSKKAEKCLKIIVGDLVNKGPKSEKVLKACRDIYPDSILSVRGNHDDIVLEHCRLYKEDKKSLSQKMKWIETLPQRYIDYLSRLPYSIRIPSLKSIIVHGGINPSLQDPAVSTPTNIMTTMRNIVVNKNPKTNETSYECTKSANDGACWALFWPGPEHVYFGHDARRRLQTDHEFATGLDSGCVYGDSLSYIYIKGPRKGEIVSIKAKKVYQPVNGD